MGRGFLLVIVFIVFAAVGCKKKESRNELAAASVVAPSTAPAPAPAPRDRGAEIDTMIKLLDRARELEASQRWEEAEAIELFVLDYHRRSGHDDVVAMLHARLGLLNEGQKRWSAAIEHFREALAAYERLGRTRTLEQEDLETRDLAVHGIERVAAAVRGDKN